MQMTTKQTKRCWGYGKWRYGKWDREQRLRAVRDGKRKKKERIDMIGNFKEF